MAAGILVSILRGVVGSSVVLSFPGNCFFSERTGTRRRP